MGAHGFHVHQYGDVRSVSDLSTMSAHFVPDCIPEEVPPGGGANLTNGCLKDQLHGLPPSIIRQPGDMGNVMVGPSRALQLTLTIGQQKMSLTDSHRSIVGRTVVFHSQVDDGSQPYGNAGLPQAYGVIGMARPADGATNAVQAPTVPKVDKLICTFEGAYAGVATSAPSISGSALLQLLEPHRPGVVRMQAHLNGLSRSSRHSFHFHTWGDMTVGMSQLGAIYSSNAIDVEQIAVDVLGVAYYDAEFETSSLLQHVGRALTIHQGGDASTPTIAAAACGLAHPRAALDMSGAPNSGSSGMALSGGATFVVVITILVLSLVLGTGCLYYMRLPIPICGRWLYAQEASFGSMPPPPPPPQELGSPSYNTAHYPPGAAAAQGGFRVEKL